MDIPVKDISLAFFDIDGTLLGLDGHYTRRLKRAIAAVQERGIKTAVASGRPKFAADFLIDELGLSAAGLFYTGALIYDPESDTTLAQHSLDDELVERLSDVARQRGVYTEVCTRDHFYIEQPHPISEKHSAHLRCVPSVRSFADLLGKAPVIKLLFAVQSRAEQCLLRELEMEFPQAVFAYACMPAKPDWLFVSVISSQACKQTAFQRLIDYHSVTAEQVIAFGDAHSDRQFLSLAGLGVAMGNASADIQAVADRVTLPVWDDGVAVVLEELLE